MNFVRNFRPSIARIRTSRPERILVFPLSASRPFHLEALTMGHGEVPATPRTIRLRLIRLINACNLSLSSLAFLRRMVIVVIGVVFMEVFFGTASFLRRFVFCLFPRHHSLSREADRVLGARTE